MHVLDAIAVGDQCRPSALLQLDEDLLDVVGLPRVVTVGPPGQGPHHARVSDAEDETARRLRRQAAEASPEAADAGRRRLEVEHRGGEPVVDGISPALHDAPEAVQLHQP